MDQDLAFADDTVGCCLVSLDEMKVLAAEFAGTTYQKTLTVSKKPGSGPVTGSIELGFRFSGGVARAGSVVTGSLGLGTAIAEAVKVVSDPEKTMLPKLVPVALVDKGTSGKSELIDSHISVETHGIVGTTKPELPTLQGNC